MFRIANQGTTFEVSSFSRSRDIMENPTVYFCEVAVRATLNQTLVFAIRRPLDRK